MKIVCRRKILLLAGWMLFAISLAAQPAAHQLQLKRIDSSSSLQLPGSIKTSFPDRVSCMQYALKLDSLLALQGFATASIDSIRESDSLTTVYLFLGQHYRWGAIRVEGITTGELLAAGLEMDSLTRKLQVPLQRNRSASISGTASVFSTNQLESIHQKLLNHLYNSGYPFASVQLDSVELYAVGPDTAYVGGKLTIRKGLPYKLDSIRVLGKASISENFLHRYLDLPRGMPFQKQAFENISIRIRELPFLQEQKPWAIRFGGMVPFSTCSWNPGKAARSMCLLGYCLPPTQPDKINSR